jgi:hypothetical protein
MPRRMMRIRHAVLAAGAMLGVGAVSLRAPAQSVSAPPADAGAAVIARLQYDGGGDWYANPSSLPNLIGAVRSRTAVVVSPQEVRLRVLDERLSQVAFLHVTGHGEFKLSEPEAVRLRAWLLRGGFLHVDDNYGLDPSFRREIARVFPDRPLVEVPLTHAVYAAVFPFPRGLPKIHEHDGKPPRGFGVFVGDRLAVFYSHESDLGNGWEDVGTYPDDPPEKHEAALRMGVNLVAYALTSRPAP